MRDLHLPLTALALGLVFSASTCSNKNDDAPKSELMKGKWELRSLDGTEINMPDGIETPYLELDSTGERISGFAGCNRLMGSIEISADSISFPGLVSTRMYCEATQKVENEFLKVLRGTRTYRLSNGRLVLLGGKELAVLQQKD